MLKRLIRFTALLIALFCILNIEQLAVACQGKMDVEFQGNKVFSSGTLLKKLNLCLVTYSDSPDEYHANVFEECRRSVQRFFMTQGYLRSVVGEPKVEKTEGGLKVTMQIEEGALYRLGSIELEGVTVFPPEQLLKMLNLKTGDVADGGKLGEWFNEKLRKAYEDRGYTQFECEAEPEFKIVTGKENEGVFNVKLHVTEG
jgi:outer membrane protein insertion porin family